MRVDVVVVGDQVTSGRLAKSVFGGGIAASRSQVLPLPWKPSKQKRRNRVSEKEGLLEGGVEGRQASRPSGSRRRSNVGNESGGERCKADGRTGETAAEAGEEDTVREMFVVDVGECRDAAAGQKVEVVHGRQLLKATSRFQSLPPRFAGGVQGSRQEDPPAVGPDFGCERRLSMHG
jgi:hypothetical protein